MSFQAGERAATGTPLSSAAYDSDKVLRHRLSITVTEILDMTGGLIYLILFQVESYFDQAFLKEDEIGAGDFGRVFRVRSRVSLKLSVKSCQSLFAQVDQKVYAVKIARERYRGPTDRARKLEEVNNCSQF